MSKPFELDYDAMVSLDAENLAEEGIGRAYARLQPDLGRFIDRCDSITEEIDSSTGRYVVRCGNGVFVIYDPNDADADESWGRATHALFTMVNSQLAGSTHRFYALNGGYDLSGLFLTPQEAAAARLSLESKTDWPYIPTLDGPWYGQEHD